MTKRTPRNAPGKFYITGECINCSLCPEIAPEIFRTDHEQGHEYVFRQPEAPWEETLCLEAMDLCPVNAIRDNGIAANQTP